MLLASFKCSEKLAVAQLFKKLPTSHNYRLYCERDESSPHPLALRPNLHFQPTLLCVLHAPPISSSLIWQQWQYLAKSTNLSHTKGRTYIEGVRKLGAEENIWTWEGGSGGRLEKTA